jgi:hypothetical protein
LVVGDGDRRVIQPLTQQSFGVELRSDVKVGAYLLDNAGDPLIVGRLQRAVLYWVAPHAIRHASMLAPTVPAAKASEGRTSASAHAGAVSH